MGVNPLYERWNLLDHLFDLNTWLPLREAVGQHVQKDVTPVCKWLSSKLRLSYDQRWLKGVFVSQENFEAKFVLLEFFGSDQFVRDIQRETSAECGPSLAEDVGVGQLSE